MHTCTYKELLLYFIGFRQYHNIVITTYTDLLGVMSQVITMVLQVATLDKSKHNRIISTAFILHVYVYVHVHYTCSTRSASGMNQNKQSGANSDQNSTFMT